jgi:sulfotransferase
LLDFIDHLADFDRFGRADQLFAKDKSIGAPLSSIRAVQDLPQSVKEHLYFVRFEDLMARPAETMEKVYKFIGASTHTIDADNLSVRAHESDSHYRFKYRHRQQNKVSEPKHHQIPARIKAQIEQVNAWYYEWFYPQIPHEK